MTLKTLLVANRGEIAIRDHAGGLRAGAPHRRASTPPTTPTSLHTRKADESRSLGAGGARRLPRHRTGAGSSPPETGADAIHPGYGFLAENARFAARLRRGRHHVRRPAPPAPRPVRRQGGGPGAGRASRRPRAARHAGRRHRRRRRRVAADRWGPDGAMMLKATAGGGGRGSRIVTAADELAAAVRTLPLGGTLGVRRRHAVRRGAGPPGPARRGADRRRRHRRGQPPVGARVQPPAPAPEARRDRPGAAPRPTSCAPGSTTTPCGWRPTSATPASGRSSSSSTPTPAATSSSRPTPGCRSSTP